MNLTMTGDAELMTGADMIFYWGFPRQIIFTGVDANGVLSRDVVVVAVVVLSMVFVLTLFHFHLLRNAGRDGGGSLVHYKDIFGVTLNWI